MRRELDTSRQDKNIRILREEISWEKLSCVGISWEYKGRMRQQEEKEDDG